MEVYSSFTYGKLVKSNGKTIVCEDYHINICTAYLKYFHNEPELDNTKKALGKMMNKKCDTAD